MYGSQMGTLLVTVISGADQQDWIQAGDHGTEWIQADITIKTTQNFRVQLKTKRVLYRAHTSSHTV